jgi:hypothetical protein
MVDVGDEFVWLKKRTSVGSCENINKPSFSVKGDRMSMPAEPSLEFLELSKTREDT